MLSRIAWWLLVVLAGLTVLLPFLDFAGIVRQGIPADHAPTFKALAGQDFSSAQSPAQYIRQLESAYAIHELTFALLFLVIVLIPFRRGEMWAWWAAWIPLVAYIGYTLTFAQYAMPGFAYSLVPDVLLPVLLLVQLPRFRSADRQKLRQTRSIDEAG